jgi:GntR family transcriptional regulator of vanillate catabolism
MATQINHVITELRRRILAGTHQAGERLVELHLAAELGVSRTPIRLAFEELEKEGVLERLPTRGFRVRGFSVDEVADAIDVRGTLEGMAARLAAQRGIRGDLLLSLKACALEGRQLLDQAAANLCRIDASAWVPMNVRFHRTLLEAAGNRTLTKAMEQVSRSPLAGAASLSLQGVQAQLEFTFISRAQQDHEDVVDAIVARDGTRAEALMREHALRSRDNKRELLTGVRSLAPRTMGQASPSPSAVTQGSGASR